MVPRETALRPEYAFCAAIRCASVTAGMTFCSTVELIIRCASVTTGLTFCSTVEVNCGSTTLGGGNFVFAPLLASGCGVLLAFYCSFLFALIFYLRHSFPCHYYSR